MSNQFQAKAKKVKPGDRPIYKSKEGVYLNMNMDPTWINLPNELGGKRVNVQDIFVAKVCKCGQHPAKVFILEGNYLVVECPINGWTWCQKPHNIEEFKRGLV